MQEHNGALGISAAGIKRIIAATKKRWAGVRAQKAAASKKTVKPAAKKAGKKIATRGKPAVKKSPVKKAATKKTAATAMATPAAEQSSTS